MSEEDHSASARQTAKQSTQKESIRNLLIEGLEQYGAKRWKAANDLCHRALKAVSPR